MLPRALIFSRSAFLCARGWRVRSGARQVSSTAVRRSVVGIGRFGVVLFLVGCGTISRSAPAPTPASFPGIASVLSERGITIDHIVSGDAGCPDQNLAKTAIAFEGHGLDQPTPVQVYVYIFRNRETYERLRSTVDGCARSYVKDPATYEAVETSPYVVSGQGPWGPAFRSAVRAAIDEAAGTGD